MQREIRLLDVVAVREDIPSLNLHEGQVGTVVELLSPPAYEVEFCDNQGQAYATAALRLEQLLLLHHEPVDSRQE